jgi:hypothetical protein
MPRGQARAALRVRVEGGQQLARMSAELKAAGDKTLQKSMRKRLREAVKPIAEEIKRDAAPQSKMVAKSITTQFSYSGKRAGATIAAKRSKMPPGKEGLPSLLEFGNRGRRGVLRHPVFAEKDEPRRKWTWAEQPVKPYFFANARRNNNRVTDAMVKVLDDVEKELRGKP